MGKIKNGLLGLLGLVSLAGYVDAQEGAPIRPENFNESYSYYTSALDGSKVLVVADPDTWGKLYKTDPKTGKVTSSKETNFFRFFRDESGNGFADSKGEMLYEKRGLINKSYIIREEAVPDSTYNLKEIKNQHNK